VQERSDHFKGWRIKEYVSMERRQEDIYYSWCLILRWSFCVVYTTAPCFIHKPFLTQWLRPSGMLHCVTGWLVPNISKVFSAFIFRVKKSKTLIWPIDPENEGNMIFWNIKKYLPNDKEYHSRRLESSWTLLSEHQISHLSFIFFTSALKVEAMFLWNVENPF
jgi:hypothetical protein